VSLFTNPHSAAIEREHEKQLKTYFQRLRETFLRPMHNRLWGVRLLVALHALEHASAGCELKSRSDDEALVMSISLELLLSVGSAVTMNVGEAFAHAAKLSLLVMDDVRKHEAKEWMLVVSRMNVAAVGCMHADDEEQALRSFYELVRIIEPFATGSFLERRHSIALQGIWFLYMVARHTHSDRIRHLAIFGSGPSRLLQSSSTPPPIARTVSGNLLREGDAVYVVRCDGTQETALRRIPTMKRSRDYWTNPFISIRNYDHRHSITFINCVSCDELDVLFAQVRVQSPAFPHVVEGFVKMEYIKKKPAAHVGRELPFSAQSSELTSPEPSCKEFEVSLECFADAEGFFHQEVKNHRIKAFAALMMMKLVVDRPNLRDACIMQLEKLLDKHESKEKIWNQGFADDLRGMLQRNRDSFSLMMASSDTQSHQFPEVSCHPHSFQHQGVNARVCGGLPPPPLHAAAAPHHAYYGEQFDGAAPVVSAHEPAHHPSAYGALPPPPLHAAAAPHHAYYGEQFDGAAFAFVAFFLFFSYSAHRLFHPQRPVAAAPRKSLFFPLVGLIGTTAIEAFAITTTYSVCARATLSLSQTHPWRNGCLSECFLLN
jgi:hypothetical protein